jgi:hypothetical protein
MVDAYTESMQAPCLLTTITERRGLSSRTRLPFQVNAHCTKQEIEELWEKIHEIDTSVLRADSTQAQLRTLVHSLITAA